MAGLVKTTPSSLTSRLGAIGCFGSSCAALHVTVLHEASAEKSTVEARVVAGATGLAESVVRSALGRCGVVYGASGAARTMRVRPGCAMSCLWSH